MTNFRGFEQLVAISGIIGGIAFAIATEIFTSENDWQISEDDWRSKVIFKPLREHIKELIVLLMILSGVGLLTSTIVFGSVVVTATEMQIDQLPANNSSVGDLPDLKQLQPFSNRAYRLFIGGLFIFVIGGALITCSFSNGRIALVGLVIIVALVAFLLHSLWRMYFISHPRIESLLWAIQQT